MPNYTEEQLKTNFPYSILEQTQNSGTGIDINVPNLTSALIITKGRKEFLLYLDDMDFNFNGKQIEISNEQGTSLTYSDGKLSQFTLSKKIQETLQDFGIDPNDIKPEDIKTSREYAIYEEKEKREILENAPLEEAVEGKRTLSELIVLKAYQAQKENKKEEGMSL